LYRGVRTASAIILSSGAPTSIRRTAHTISVMARSEFPSPPTPSLRRTAAPRSCSDRRASRPRPAAGLRCGGPWSPSPAHAGLDSFGAECERQRRSVPKPRVAAQRLPWDHGYSVAINPNGVAPSGWVRRGRNPVGVRWARAPLTQGRRSHVAPTMGFESERRWRSQSLATVLRTDRRTRSLDPTPADVSISAVAAHASGPAWVSSALGEMCPAFFEQEATERTEEDRRHVLRYLCVLLFRLSSGWSATRSPDDLYPDYRLRRWKEVGVPVSLCLPLCSSVSSVVKKPPTHDDVCIGLRLRRSGSPRSPTVRRFCDCRRAGLPLSSG
jgi:hypothetical protein